MVKKYLTPAEGSDLTGRKLATLGNDRYYRIPFIKMGGSVRYEYDEVVSWMEAKEVKTTDWPLTEAA